ncbi:zinc-binding dehydrogenase [Amycolatopsis sp. NPDC059657]|uniref:zinc-binding dehydrogenase n=1 Tax=Amycolatopsis sp. NPDC059657 TaxID=3346899 RepID=UPI00366EBE06
MRAVWLKEFGGPGVLVAGEAPDPVAGPGEALIEVDYVNTTFVETRTRAGTGPFPVELPMIPGNGVGGVVRDGPPEWIGKRVVSSLRGSGGYAELAVAPVANLVEVPDGVAMDAAVAVLADGRTATMLIRAAGLRAWDTVLVEAAAGGVGGALVQLALAAGATVIALAGGEEKVELARKLGAHFAIDYRRDDWPDRVYDATFRVDVVFDGVGGPVGRQAFELLDKGGRMVSFGLAGGSWTDTSDADSRGVTVVKVPRPDPEELRELVGTALSTVASGVLRPVIGQRFPLEKAADAHAAMESRGTVGKTLLVP